MDNTKRKRITMKLKTPNPLFEKWLTEWRDKARRENSKMEYCFKLALQSLKKYPVSLERVQDCKILKGFGDKLCLMLENKLKEHQMNAGNNINDIVIENGHSINEPRTPVKKKKKSIPADSPSTKKRRHSKEYMPQEGSGGYAILITLYTHSLDPHYPGFLTKEQIITDGQPLSSTSFTKPDPGSRYTAWSSMKTLISKNLIIKNSSPAKFSLSDEGLNLARKLLDGGKCADSNESSASFETKTRVNVENDIICIDLSDEDETAPSPKCGASGSGISSDSEIPTMKQSNYFENYSATDVKCSATSTHGSEDPIETEEMFSFCDQKIETTYKYTSSSATSSQSFSSALSFETGDTNQNNKGKSKAIQKHPSSTSVASSTQSSSQEECFIFPPNTFDIILVIDTCETSGSNAIIQNDPILAELFQLGVIYEVKKLKIGDYVWICRDKVSKKELVLPYIVERKRMDDFAQSIKDGRYHEQKFRLKKCGIQNIIYLIEKYGHSQYVGLPITTLYQAATNTAIQDGFCVKFTQNIRDTARYLANLSTILIKMFESKTIVSCPKENLSEISPEDDLVSIMTFKEFNQASSKNKPMTVSDLFVKMLIQIKGMSVDKALAIVNEYPTPALLRNAYEENPGTKGEKLLASIKFGDCEKSIGPVLSKIVHQLFTLESFN